MSEYLKGKKIGVLCPRFFDYQDIIENGIIEEGAEVVIFDERPSNSFLMKFSLRMGFRWLVYPMIFFYYYKIFKSFLLRDIDTLLVINPESVPIWFLKYLKSSTNVKLVLYMWDSFNNKKYARKLIRFMDRAYSFDIEDARKTEGMEFLSLFFIKDDSNALAEKTKYDIVFIGTLHSDRYNFIKEIERQALAESLNVFVFIYVPNKIYFYVRRIFDRRFRCVDVNDVSFSPLKHSDNLDIMNSANAILDVQHPSQKGLTMRTIESLGAKKKLVTTNESVKSFDFFHPDNILVMDREKPNLNLTFLRKPIRELPEDVYLKYSLSQWLYILLKDDD
ncbi:hypothetical protein [Moritella sp. 28]|uniref:hypothetical protein n=1 Tax=Moritella sp. 28 TaxID=2746232 RepID=UPI001BA8F1FA|nr:hypothetical protein [Moritella sp. 28]QUM83595.1 hypothetical protein HWV02_03200 [Moritella sp. 28]